MAHDEQNQCKAGDLVLLKKAHHIVVIKMDIKRSFKIYENKKIFELNQKNKNYDTTPNIFNGC
jgi:ribosomal protein S17